jgi:hypothetical protein
MLDDSLTSLDAVGSGYPTPEAPRSTRGGASSRRGFVPAGPSTRRGSRASRAYAPGPACRSSVRSGARRRRASSRAASISPPDGLHATSVSSAAGRRTSRTTSWPLWRKAASARPIVPPAPVIATRRAIPLPTRACGGRRAASGGRTRTSAPGAADVAVSGTRQGGQLVLHAIGEAAALPVGGEQVVVRPVAEGPLDLDVTDPAADLVAAVGGHPAPTHRALPQLQHHPAAILEAAVPLEDADAVPRREQPLERAGPRVPGPSSGDGRGRRAPEDRHLSHRSQGNGAPLCPRGTRTAPRRREEDAPPVDPTPSALGEFARIFPRRLRPSSSPNEPYVRACGRPTLGAGGA